MDELKIATAIIVAKLMELDSSSRKPMPRIPGHKADVLTLEKISDRYWSVYHALKENEPDETGQPLESQRPAKSPRKPSKVPEQ
jgi:hypothetical protein